MDEKIFRGQDWYIIVDKQLTFGYSNGILHTPIKDIDLLYISSMYDTSEIKIFISSIRLTIKIDDCAATTYSMCMQPTNNTSNNSIKDWITIYVPKDVFYKICYALNLRELGYEK